VAGGDVSGITGAASAGAPHVRVFDLDRNVVVFDFFAYDTSFLGGVFVSAGDVDGNGRADIITGAGQGGGSHVKVFSGQDLSLIHTFFAYPGFFGGVRVAANDLNGDGRDDIITGAGPGGGPHVRAFDGQTLAQLDSFFAYSAFFTGGVFVG
jgi:serralysin